MLFAILAVALAGQPVLSAEMEAERVFLLGKTKAVLASVTEFQGFVSTRFAGDTRQPKTGLIITSASEPGEDKLHAITVVGVYQQSPGYEAGVRPGDRIVRLDARRLEHEPKIVVDLLLDDKPGPVALTLRRGSKTLEVTIVRRSLPCLARASAELDTSVWLKQLDTMRSLAQTSIEFLELKEFLQLDQADRQDALDASHSAVLAISTLLPILMETVGHELHKATMSSCQATFE